MIANAAVVAEPGRRYPRLRSQAPAVVRPTRDGIYFVGGAAGPLGGDTINIEIDVRADATLTVRSAAATVVLPGPGPSLVSVRATVAADATLRWCPEPTVLARGCRHGIEASVVVEAGGTLEWWDELLLGRHDEPGGSVESRLHVDYAGRPLLRHDLSLDGRTSSAVTGGAKAVGALVLVGAHARGTRVIGSRAARMELDGPGVLIVALADDRLSLVSALGQVEDHHP